MYERLSTRRVFMFGRDFIVHVTRFNGHVTYVMNVVRRHIPA